MKARFIGIAVLVALMGMLVSPVGSALAAKKTFSPFNVPVTSSLTNGATGTLQNGQLSITKFTTQNGQLAAVGTLTGTVVDAAGNVVGTVTQQVTLPVAASGSCQILHLTLGPLDLNLLGLQVHLDRVVLDITAQSGPGNLLGNLLCAIANLLNGNTPLTQIASLLNNLLRLFQ